MRHNFLTPCANSYTRIKVAGRSPLYAGPNDASTGRSMVEMLGVLAIIGVLSVGAIAGYSKAMIKYKLNKQAEQLNTVINVVASNAHSFSNLGANTSLVNIFTKMGEIPTEMLTSNPIEIQDIFGIRWEIFINSLNDTIFLHSNSSSFLRSSSADNLAVCQNIFTTAKENAANINFINTLSNYAAENEILKIWYGDKYCNNQSYKCLRTLTLDDIYAACTTHKGTNLPYFQITWNK